MTCLSFASCKFDCDFPEKRVCAAPLFAVSKIHHTPVTLISGIFQIVTLTFFHLRVNDSWIHLIGAFSPISAAHLTPVLVSSTFTWPLAAQAGNARASLVDLTPTAP
jgi:hypothetical protein